MRFVKNPGSYAETLIHDELVLMNIRTAQFQALGGVALDIWRLLDSEPDPDVIKSILVERYDVDAAICATEVDRFIQELEQAHLLVPS